MKKLISICIVLAILRITCQYAETVGVYQTEVIKGKMINVQNDVWIEALAIAVQSDWSGVRRLIKMSNNRREHGKIKIIMMSMDLLCQIPVLEV